MLQEKKTIIKVLLLNGSPRPNHNTAKALNAAKEGAENAGAETEIINLFKIKDLKGCYSCYRCQRDEFDKSNPMCCVKDSLSPVLEKARAADVVIVGSPVYFYYPTSETMAFMNRFLFPKLSYINNAAYSPDFKVVNPKRIGCIFTMNSPVDYFEASGEAKIIGHLADASKSVYGYGESLFMVQTAAFDDYKGLQFSEQFVKSQQAYYKEHFPKDLEKARELGKRLVDEVVAEKMSV
ncbi:MAG: flavodoxin family protein [Bacteroides sp.]|nr:flavodoxin family protein [Bacteroides sp.]